MTVNNIYFDCSTYMYVSIKGNYIRSGAIVIYSTNIIFVIDILLFAFFIAMTLFKDCYHTLYCNRGGLKRERST